MAPGLKKILDLIKTSPKDDRLLSRYISLSNELNEAEQAEATLRVVEVLISKVPEKGLDLAWKLYKSGKFEKEALSNIAVALDTLGKTGKATALRVDADRLQTLPDGSKEKEQARQRIETTVGAVKGSSKSQFSIDEDTKTNGGVVRDKSMPKSGIMSGAPATTSSVDPQIVSKMKEPDLVGLQEKAADVAHFDLISKVAPEDPAATTTGAGIPEPIPRKEPSSHSKSILDRLSRTQASVAGSSPVEKQDQAGSIPTSSTPSERVDYIRELISTNSWDELLQYINVSFHGSNDPVLLQILETEALAKIDIQFASLWLDVLIANHQERRAVRHIVQILSEEPHHSWAKMVRPRVDQIVERLGLQSLIWTETEGVSVLRKRIAGLQPMLRVYPILPAIGS